ncbi:MAG: helix-turn-helix domain-containing protein [Egibacteraceae bacterium]
MGQRVAINGKVLAELRILRRFTQEGLRARCEERDRHCGLTAERISEYEREVRQPTWPNLLALVDALAVSDAEWCALVHTPTLDSLVSPEPGEGVEVDRRTANQAIGAAFGGLVVPPEALGALDASVERIVTQERIDAGLIADHEQIADAYALLHFTTRPARLFGLVAHQADTLYGLLDQPASPNLERRLYVVSAGSHAQAGLLAFIAGDHANARRYAALATDIAEDSRNDILHAQTLGVASMAHREPGGRAASMMAQAVDLAPNADRDTQGWLHSWHANRLALADDARGFLTHMHRAGQLWSGTADEAGFLMRYAGWPCSPDVDFAVGLTALKRGDEALEAFAAVADPPDPRGRACVLAYRGEAHLVKKAPDPEAACADLGASFDLGREHGAMNAVERIHEIRVRFPKRYAGSACLAKLDERLGRA